MGSLGNPKAWVPYMTTKDCSQGICSFYCQKWCYIIFPPPPPSPFTFPEERPSQNFPPLVIAIIGILVSAFLIVSYYVIISKFCGKRDSSRRREDHDSNEELVEIHDPLTHEPWVIETPGLDESLIKSIQIFKYKKRDGSVHESNCSVCLSEFQEDESLKLLPKCTHAFHVTCIDTWLKCHTNCPLCRANIVFVNPSPSPPNSENVDFAKDIESGVREDEIQLGNVKRSQLRALRDLGNLEELNIDQRIRRSVSMDNSRQRCAWDSDMEEGRYQSEVGSSKGLEREIRKFMVMKRSFSSGRFLFTKHGIGQNSVIPL